MFEAKKVSPAGGDLEGVTKHEIISCERCGIRIECKANAYTKCQCSVVQLTINEVHTSAKIMRVVCAPNVCWSCRESIER
jgi:hypothetical protein